jgi:hypothetical protein
MAQYPILWNAWSAWLTGRKPLVQMQPLLTFIRSSLLRQALFTEQLAAICDGLPASTEFQLIKCQHLEAQLLWLMENRHRLRLDPETGEPLAPLD